MIVVSHPRSGATKYCQNLEKETGKTFSGELFPGYIQDLGSMQQPKAAVHETGYQPIYTRQEWLNLLELPSDKIILVNKMGAFLAPQADVVVLREDFIGSLMSMTNLLFKFHGTTQGGALTWTRLIIQETYGLLTYCCNSDKKIVWFEDLYPKHTQKLKNLDKQDQLFYKTFYMKAVSQTPIPKQIKFLRTRNPS